MMRPKPRHFGQAPNGELKEKRAAVGLRRVKPVFGLVQVVENGREEQAGMPVSLMVAWPLPRVKAASRASRRREWFSGVRVRRSWTMWMTGENGIRGPVFVGADDLAVEEDAEVALGVEEGEDVFGFGVRRDGDGEGDQDGFSREIFPGPGGGGFGGVGLDGFAGVRVVADGEAGEEELEVVVDLGERADGRAGGADVVFLLDGDGGRDAVDVIDGGLVHAVEELPDVGRERLDVAALALGVEGVEGERGFSGAGRTGDDGEFSERDIEVEPLEIVLAAAAEEDGGLERAEWRFLVSFGHAGG